MKSALKILFVDSLGGLVAGFCTIMLGPLLTVWYGWPAGFALFIGLVNISYGCFSGFLALRLYRKDRLSRGMVIILLLANSIWAGQCFTQVWWLHENASYLGLAHLLFEGLWVGGLAYLEARIVLPFVT